MKRFLITLIISIVTLPAFCQKVFTMVYATSDDGFVNVRATPSPKGRIVGQITELYGGLGDGILLSNGKWCKVQTLDGKVGYCDKSYLGMMTFIRGNGHQLVASKTCPIYCESYADGSLSLICRVAAGTVITDEYSSYNGKYYCIETAGQNLYIPKNRVSVK